MTAAAISGDCGLFAATPIAVEGLGTATDIASGPPMHGSSTVEWTAPKMGRV